MKLQKTIFILLTVFYFSCNSQKRVTADKNTVDNSVENTTKDWKYFTLQDTIFVKVIAYSSAHTRCDRATENAMAIAQDNVGDTIRIIEVCPGPKNIEVGQLYILHFDQTIPENKNPNLIYIDNKPNSFIFKYPTIKKTTYGRLSLTLK